MRNLVLIIVMVVLLVGCGPNDVDCDIAWGQMEVPYGQETAYIEIAINEESPPPDSVGHTIKECIKSGWRGYR